MRRTNTEPRGAIDRFIRRYNAVSYGLAVLALYALGATALGLALAPAVWLVLRAGPAFWPAVHWYDVVALAVLVATALFVWGFALLVVVPIYNLLLPTRLHAFRGGYFTVAAVPWYLHNGLFYLARFTFLPFVTLTPFGVLFLRAMGMKVGKRARITTENFSDPCLITLGDDVVIGGSAHVFCHYGGGGHLVIAPVRIGSRATIGLKATVMGDVVVGDGATILPHSVLLPGTRVGPGERWGGVPARRIAREEWEAYKRAIGAVDGPASEALTRRPRRRAYIRERTLAERPQ
ncbi:MAG TPA: hypothetical protein VHB25_18270 [Gemmatimonadaceae bacterium]|nr:hypothetical protein [Gemmatimonadaceae bacterium]